ncbi:MAG: glycosyltransferase family 39 protein [Bacteroidota bacterium]
MAFSDFRTKEFLALAGLALLLRISFLGSYDHAPVSDEKDYLELAVNFVATGSYSLGGEPTAFRPPGYPAFLAVVQLIFGQSITAIRIVQMFLDIGIVAGLYLLGFRFGRTTGLVAGLAWALFPPAIIYSGLILSETLSAFLLVLLFATLTFKPFPATTMRSFAAGLIAGVLILVKSWIVLFAAGLLCFFWIRVRSRSMALLFGSGILLVVAPWMVRNVTVFGTPVISTNSGINLYMGNNPEATGAYKAGLPDTLLAASSDELKYQRLSLSLAIDHIVENPGVFVQRIPVKVAHMFRSEGELLVWAFHPNIRDKSISFSDKYRILPIILTIGVNILYAFILLAGIAGLLRFRSDEVSSLVLVFFGSLLAIHALFFGGSRFHFLLMPLMAFATARLLPNIRNFWAELSLTGRISFIMTTSFLVSVWILEFTYVFS